MHYSQIIIGSTYNKIVRIETDVETMKHKHKYHIVQLKIRETNVIIYFQIKGLSHFLNIWLKYFLMKQRESLPSHGNLHNYPWPHFISKLFIFSFFCFACFFLDCLLKHRDSHHSWANVATINLIRDNFVSSDL